MSPNNIAKYFVQKLIDPEWIEKRFIGGAIGRISILFS